MGTTRKYENSCEKDQILIRIEPKLQHNDDDNDLKDEKKTIIDFCCY